MRTKCWAWLYDPKNDYEGKIFSDAQAYSRALADGWETAPYPDEQAVEKEKIITAFDTIPFVESASRPGRKPNTMKTRKK